MTSFCKSSPQTPRTSHISKKKIKSVTIIINWLLRRNSNFLLRFIKFSNSTAMENIWNSTSKATGFKSLRLNYWEIDQATSKWQIDFWTKIAKKVQNRKSEHRYEILHIQISLGTKFRLKVTLLNFWIKFIQKEYFWTKKMKITIEFYIFKLI